MLVKKKVVEKKQGCLICNDPKVEDYTICDKCASEGWMLEETSIPVPDHMK